MTTVTLTYVNIGAADPVALARFYAGLLGWQMREENDQCTEVSNPAGGVGLSCQLEKNHVRPRWPADAGAQQMQMHLEIQVDDLNSAITRAVDLGAQPADFQPQDDVRVCFDPEGLPFCLYL